MNNLNKDTQNFIKYYICIIMQMSLKACDANWCVRYHSNESVRDYAIGVFSIANQERQRLTTHNINPSDT